MPSISPVQDQVLENGVKEIGTNLCEMAPWTQPPSNKYPVEGELKAFVPIMNQMLTNGESVVQTGLDGAAPDYHTDLGYSSNITTDWESVHPRDWTPNQVIDWLYTVFRRDYENVRIDNFRSVNGKHLIHMKKIELCNLLHDESHADRVYSEIQQLILQYEYGHQNSCIQNAMLSPSMFTPTTYDPTTTDYSYIPYPMSDIVYPGDYGQTRSYNQTPFQPYQNGIDSWYNTSRSDVESDNESGHSTFNSPYADMPSRLPVEESQKPHRRGPGRPPREGKKNKKNGQRSSRLWEFIRDLLKDKDTCPRLVKWEDRDEGVFRFVQSDQVAKLWGERKSNPRMTYEKLSRAMRYYYKSKVLQPVLGRRLVYKFGPCATGWRPNETNA